MVGVPGRSKGCNTCIQRKIRCDLGIPLCGNCQKSNRLCTGYKRRLGYVLSRDVSIADLADLNREKTSVTHQGRWRRTKSQQPPLATYQVAQPQPAMAGNSPPYPSLDRQVSAKTVLRQQFHCLFLNCHLPTEILEKSHLQSVVTRNWILQLEGIVIESPALETSISAFFAAQLGRKNNDINLIHQSRSMYVAGLERLQQALNNPQTRLSEETLATCMALSLYELTECPRGALNAYMTHQRGAMMLLQLRGPDASTSLLGHSLFLALRSQTIVASLTYHYETFLSRPEWMEGPWKLVPKNPYDELLDLLFDVPAILRQSKELFRKKNRTMLPDGFRDITAKCLKVESALRAFYGTFEKSASGPLYWPELSTLESRLDDMKLGKVFPVSFHFPAFLVAQIVTTYWAGMMAVHLQLRHTYDMLASIASSTALANTTDTSAGNGPCSAVPFNLRSREHGDIWKTMAKNICQSGEYFMQEKMGWMGPISMFTLLHGCKSCMESVPEDWSREINWITDIIELIRKKFRFPVDNVLGG